MEEMASKYGGCTQIFTESFRTNKFTVLLLCISPIIGIYLFRRNMYDLIRIELQNSKTVHLLVVKEFVTKFKMHGMGNMTVDKNIFDKLWRLTDKSKFSSFVVGRHTNYYPLLKFNL